MIMVATHNFRSVDQLLASPGRAGAQVQKLGHSEARTFLRYHVSEQNRWYFRTWETIQVVALGLALLAATLRQSKFGYRWALALFLLVMTERFYITPEIIRLGRLIDFVPPAVSSPERDTFWRFHGAYSAVELLKLALGFLLSGRLIFGRERIGNQVDVVDEADHSHIDR